MFALAQVDDHLYWSGTAGVWRKSIRNGVTTQLYAGGETLALAVVDDRVYWATEDRVMLIRHRKSRIYYLRRFFDYPITLSKDTLVKIGLWRLVAGRVQRREEVGILPQVKASKRDSTNQGGQKGPLGKRGDATSHDLL